MVIEVTAKAVITAASLVTALGILACLKGLQEKGCNGPVSEARRRSKSI